MFFNTSILKIFLKFTNLFSSNKKSTLVDELRGFISIFSPYITGKHVNICLLSVHFEKIGKTEARYV